MSKYFDLLRAHEEKGQKPGAKPKPGSRELDGLLAEESAAGDAPVPPPEETTLPDEEQTGPPETGAPPREPARTDTDITRWLSGMERAALALLRAARDGTPHDISALGRGVAAIVDALQKQPALLNTLELEIARRTREIDAAEREYSELLQKSIMMLLYALKIARQLNLSPSEHKQLALAAMTHHIGMAQVPAAIRQKKDPLSEEEWQRIRQSPANAAAYLKACGVGDEAVLTAVAQVPERFDGSGPEGLSGNEIHLFARIIGLLSMFEALIHYRSYRQRKLPLDAIREIVTRHKEGFDPDLLKALIDSISLYPVGSYVQLNTGEVGQVVFVHPRLPLRPRVHISLDRHGNPVRPRDVDLSEQPNLMIKRCMYEESLSELGKERA